MGQAEHDRPPFELFEAIADDGTRLRAYAGGSGPETVCYVAAHPTSPSLVLATPASKALARELSKTRRVIFPAPRGSGGSDPHGPYEPRRLAADIAALLEAVGAQRTIVWGRRLCGLVALQIARDHPQRVSGLVLDNLIVHPSLRGLFGGSEPVFDTLDPEQQAAAIELAVTQSCASQFAGAAPELVAKFVARLVQSTSPAVWAESLQAAMELIDDAPRCMSLWRAEQPVLLLASRLGMVPGNRHEFAFIRRLAKRAELVEHPNGSTAHIDQAEAVVAIVDDWWRRAGPQHNAA
jgi:pimeloyl-ACP methyl ester carboxylesterase